MSIGNGQAGAKLYFGTSGYSYDDWRGTFYPKTIKDGDMLAFYAKEFSFVEINYTFYRLPSEKTLTSMAKKCPRTLSSR
jgi:uncharacterized protein YecE (DUF72 family)